MAVLSAACAITVAGLGLTGARAAPGLGATRARTAASPASASGSASGSWPAYLHGTAHSSFSPSQKRITPSNVNMLRAAWRFTGAKDIKHGRPHGFLASPTVFRGDVYIGSSAGWFYKVSVSSGRVLAKRFIGYQRRTTCRMPLGVVSTATVQPVRKGRVMVYVGGPDGYLYAMRARDLSVAWRSPIAIPSKKVNNFFQWSSPTIAGGRIFIGISSNCDNPLVRSGLVSYSQATGKRLAIYRPMPRHLIGASIWSSPAVDSAGNVYVSTGNAAKHQEASGRPTSITKLNPRTLRAVASFKVPSSQFVRDGDFGASPVIFGSDVGACNKNGVFYALKRKSMQMAWSARIGAAAPHHASSCLASAAYNGSELFVAGPEEMIGSVDYNGSVQALNPGTGAVIWQTGLPNGVIGTPTVDGAGVIAVGTYQATTVPNGIYLLDAATGTILRELTSGSPDFAQNVFAEGQLFTADRDGLTDWRVGTWSFGN